jgi:acetyl-CoA carboxylase beta subunit
MASLKHVHTYGKSKRLKNYFKCNHPQCYHTMHKDDVIGKMSCCNICGTEFIISREDARRAKPVCLNCSNTKSAQEFRAAKEQISKLFASDPLTDDLFKGGE